MRSFRPGPLLTPLTTGDSNRSSVITSDGDGSSADKEGGAAMGGFLKSLVIVRGRNAAKTIARLSGVAGAGAILVVGVMASPAGAVAAARPHVRPLACTDSWKTAASGPWSTPANWSTGAVPTSSDNVCITIAGTYAVTISGSASAGTIVLGTSSGKESLKIIGNASTSSTLNLSAATGSQIKAKGVLKVNSKNVSGAGFAMIAGGPTVDLVNNGTILTAGGTDAPNYVRVNITNNSGGTVKIKGANTKEDSGAGPTTLTNHGTFTVTSTGNFAVSGGSSFTQAGGTLSNGGTIAESNGTFTQSGGTDSGNTISVTTATLVDSSGAGSFDLFGSDTLSGTIPSGQTVNVIGNPSSNAEATLGTNVINNGTFELDSLTTSGSGFAMLYQSSSDFTFTNNGTFETLGATVSADYLRAQITNGTTGTLTIGGAQTAEDGAQGATNITNNGTLSVGSGGGLVVGGASSFTQSAGTLTNSGSFAVSSGTFTQSGGTDSGNAISMTTSTLVDSAGGGNFNMFGSDTLSGTLPAGQTVDVIGNPSSSATITLGSNVTNNGTFELDSLTTSGSGFAMLYQSSSDFTFTNSSTGTFKTLGATVSVDYLRANITNDSGGTFTIDGANTSEDGAQGVTTLTNDGTLTTAVGGGLVVGGSSSFTQSAGTLTNSGSFAVSSGTFTQSGGTDSGNAISMTTSKLVDSAGAGSFDLFGSDTLSGTIPSGQTVDAIGTPSSSATVTLGSSVTNNGTFELDSGTASGSGYAMLYGSSSGFTFTNAGTFKTLDATVAADYLRANIVNDIGAAITVDGVQTKEDSGQGATSITNGGTLSVGDGGNLSISGGSSFTQSAGGTFSPTVDATTGVWGITGGSDTVAGTLSVNTVGSPTVGNTYNVIGGATSVTGTFSTVVGSYTVTYTATAVTVKVT